MRCALDTRCANKNSIINGLVPSHNLVAQSATDTGSFISDSIVGHKNKFITDWAGEVNAIATSYKLDSIPSTPTITPLSLVFSL